MRNPWRIRLLLASAVAALAGVGVTLSVTAGQVDAFVAAAVAVGALLAELGILRDGEAETTPVADPRGPDGLPMVTWGQAQQMAARPPGPSDARLADAFGDHADPG